MLDVSDLGSDYTLAWPRELFRQEARALLRRPRGDLSVEAGLLLAEAFVSDVPTDELKSRTGSTFDFHASPGDPARDVLTALAEGAAALPLASAPAPYWNERRGIQPPVPSVPLRTREVQLQQAWGRLAEDLQVRGYLDQAAARSCVDDRKEPDEDLDAELQLRTGAQRAWTQWWELDLDSFYAVVEAVHDLVARPRHRWWHDFNRCGWHYSTFAVDPARVLYRWKVNALLDVSGVGLRLAADGEDVGRLVHVTQDGRDHLVTTTLATPNEKDQDAVRHAISLFRARGSDRSSKRSAVVELAGVLEERRESLKTVLPKKDEGALFQIANEFEVRHRRAGQQGDYDEAFLDWMFWWYLATIELSDRLLARAAAAAVEPGEA